MAKGLTALAVEKLKPEPIRREVPDGLLTGLYLVVQPSGAKSWAVRYRVEGKPRKHTLGTYPALELADARELARKALRSVAEGNDPGTEKKAKRQAAAKAERDDLETVVSRFIERYAKANTRESTWRETERIFGREVLPQWKGRKVDDIARRDVIELLDGVADRGSPIMANRVLATIRRFFGWCVERDIIEASPCAGVAAPTAERSRDRVLSDDELRRVWNAAGAIGWPFGPLVQLLILTGQRLAEVAEMEWKELDLDKRLWTIPKERVKNNTAHEVPLSDQALAVIADLPRIVGRGGLVFTTTGNTPVGGFSRAKSRVNAAIGEDWLRWTFHDLRRTAASGMARLGINLPVIEKVLNQMSGSFGGIVGVYQRHPFADEKRRALQAWGRFVEQIALGDDHSDVIGLSLDAR